MKGLFDLPERIQSRIMPCATTGCWLWAGCLNKQTGYGAVSWKLKARPVHRLVWEILAGPVPHGLQIDHLCRERSCCNPLHLEPVTQKTNILRGESPMAKCARRTTCGRGHEYTASNAAFHKNQRGRKCKICIAERQKEYIAKGGPPCRRAARLRNAARATPKGPKVLYDRTPWLSQSPENQ